MRPWNGFADMQKGFESFIALPHPVKLNEDDALYDGQVVIHISAFQLDE